MQVLERVVEDISFHGPERAGEEIVVDREVRSKEPCGALTPWGSLLLTDAGRARGWATLFVGAAWS